MRRCFIHTKSRLVSVILDGVLEGRITLFKWPDLSLHETRTGNRAVNDQINSVGKKSVIHDGSLSDSASEPMLIFSPKVLSCVSRTSGVVRKSATTSTKMLTRAYFIFS